MQGEQDKNPVKQDLVDPFVCLSKINRIDKNDKGKDAGYSPEITTSNLIPH